MHSVFKATILQAIHRHEATRLKCRPLSLDPVEAVDCLFKLVRTGMQWRELQPSVTQIGEGLKAGVPNLVAVEVESLSLALSLSSSFIK